jgi:hypothetical protein
MRVLVGVSLGKRGFGGCDGRARRGRARTGTKGDAQASSQGTPSIRTARGCENHAVSGVHRRAEAKTLRVSDLGGAERGDPAPGEGLDTAPTERSYKARQDLHRGERRPAGRRDLLATSSRRAHRMAPGTAGLGTATAPSLVHGFRIENGIASRGRVSIPAPRRAGTSRVARVSHHRTLVDIERASTSRASGTRKLNAQGVLTRSHFDGAASKEP